MENEFVILGIFNNLPELSDLRGTLYNTHLITRFTFESLL